MGDLQAKLGDSGYVGGTAGKNYAGADVLAVIVGELEKYQPQQLLNAGAYDLV
jgi:hypothetical protein